MSDLITLDEYKLSKGMVKSDQDDRISQLITVASTIIQNYLDRNFVNNNSTVTQTFDLDYDTQILYLNYFPVTSIISVTVDDTVPTGYTDLSYSRLAYWDSTVHLPMTLNIGYKLDAVNGKLIRIGESWPQGPGSVIVEYATGSGSINDVPADLKQVTVDLVTYYLKEQYHESMSLKGATITNKTSTGTPQDNSFPPHIQRILDMYL